VTERVRVRGGNRFATLVHPLAWVGERVILEEGTIVCAGALMTTDIRVGRHVILNLDCTVGHDCVLEDLVTVAPSVNLSGNVHVGEGCDLGTGATLIQGVTVGAWTVVGAGAVVVRDLPANITAVGVPAQPIKERPAGWHEAQG
jgi:sugar O-acyltransferase (sialic acid O-acetyltransferase NeuD family)